jgi:transposase
MEEDGFIFYCLDSQGIIMIDDLEQGRTVNGTYYADEFRRLRQEIPRDSAPAHTSQVAMAAATDSGFEILPDPPHSPDLAPSDFYLFPKLKTDFVVDVLEAIKVSWRCLVSSLRTKIV